MTREQRRKLRELCASFEADADLVMQLKEDLHDNLEDAMIRSGETVADNDRVRRSFLGFASRWLARLYSTRRRMSRTHAAAMSLKSKKSQTKKRRS